ncbi:hypothetical protein PF010_g5016 [Phytophthora fragariae]|uniref:Uncharacterized protein n=1 Tax=Phytophthora fragariae TaxID=53985 RepID=A0A6A3ZD28_9STRA|nr:hypothetical protein PF003_g24690 [Phytophthora fragariae]KAE9007246.1 hypothetical protein PF011_g11212 [Phytophthora fragariae]KAE9127147.1 hypothetical protein PF010_g5016 [Phytophthora fragariae]KAE9234610.1 hypothetical protein PF002_g11753 [Phytophthora fragariae]
MRVSAVTLLLGNEARELLLYAGLSLPELLRCVASIFPALQRSGNAATSVALCHASTGVFYPLSLLRRSPELFEHAPYYLVLYGEEGGADDVDTSLARGPRETRGGRAVAEEPAIREGVDRVELELAAYTEVAHQEVE